MKQNLAFLILLLFALTVRCHITLAKIPDDYHSLTEEDLTIDKTGLITQCSYDFTKKKIAIPEEVNGKTIIGIKGNLLGGVFENKGITAVIFPSTMKIIGCRAFRNNMITSTNISLLSSLVTIEANAFLNNALLNLLLPENSATNFNGWRDSNGNEYDSGELISNFSIAYEAILAHVITDEDVTMVGSVMTSCSYGYSNTDIIIPEYLKGELVTTIWIDCFRSKNITSILLPPSLTLIQHSAFYGNNIQRLDLSICPNIQLISGAAFGWNDLKRIDFSNCSNLQKIRNSAFVSNNLDTIDLSPCASLELIEGWTFMNNNLTSFILPKNNNPHFIIWTDENDNRYQGGSIVSDLETDYTAIINVDMPVIDEVNDTLFTNNNHGCINAIQSILVAEDGNEVLFQNGSNTNFIAGQSIRLLPGTVIEPGAYLHAYITTDGSFCDDLPEAIVAANNTTEKSIELADVPTDELTQEATLKVFPNPSDGRFTVQTTGFEGQSDVVIYNSTGAVVFETQLCSEKTLELYNLRKGIYIVKAVNSNNVLSQRMIIR
jgi:hypothetical protein